MADIKKEDQPEPKEVTAMLPVLDLVQGLSLAWTHFQQEQATCTGLKRNSFLVLSLVGRAGEAGTTVSRVADELAVRPQGLSASVSELKRAGLITRSRDQSDGRAQRLRITDAGGALLGKAAGLTRRLVEEICRQIPQSSLARLILDRMVRSYQQSLAHIASQAAGD